MSHGGRTVLPLRVGVLGDSAQPLLSFPYSLPLGVPILASHCRIDAGGCPSNSPAQPSPSEGHICVPNGQMDPGVL